MRRLIAAMLPLLLLQASNLLAQAGPTQEELVRAAGSTDWLYVTHDYLSRRFVDLKQIKPSNARSLRPVCALQLSDVGSFQANPIVRQGVMYLTTRFATIAVDAATCRERWRYAVEPPPKPAASFGGFARIVLPNRGAALKDGKLVRGMPDGRLIALGADSGKLIWERTIADTSAAEMLNMPPLIFEDLIVIGPGLSEGGIRGWVGAVRMADGAPVWKFYTVPDSGTPGSETWANAGAIPHGGGAVWTPLSLDPEEGTLFVAAGNPAPDIAGHVRPGDNLYTNSLVALDIRTGALKWHRQMVPHDVHDWVLTQVSPLFTASIEGKPRRLIATAGKDGMLRVVDRESHEALFETPVTTRLNVDAPVGREPVRACPGFLGGVQWNGPAFNPGTGLLYVPAVDWCATVSAADSVQYVPGSEYVGGGMALDSLTNGTGWLTAVEATTGKVRWQYRADSPVLGGVTTTSGGLVLTGEAGGDFLVLNARDGKVVYRFYTGGPVAGGTVTYAGAGKQFVAVASGSLASFWNRPPGSATVFVFALP